MSGELTFYTHPYSRGRVARWMLEEVGAPYRTELLEYGTTMKAPAYLAINPMGKVPALKHGEAIVTECAAICAYLADAFPSAGLAPTVGDPLRATYYRWLFFAAGPLEAAATNKKLEVAIAPDKKMMVGYGSLEDVTAAIAAALKGRDYLVGNRFTAADLYLGAQVGWLMQFGMIERLPDLDRYHERLSARPAAARARAIDDALVAEAQAAGT